MALIHIDIDGSVVDQAALHGLLKKVRDLAMPLVSIIRFELGQVDVSNRETRQYL